MITLKEGLESRKKGRSISLRSYTSGSGRFLGKENGTRGSASANEQQGDPVAGVEAKASSLAIQVEDPAPDTRGEGFATLNLRDRVVIMLLFDQIITENDVAQVWALWGQEYQGDLKTPLWRLLTLIPELDQELILAEAARVYGIEEAHMTERAVIPILRRLVQHLPRPIWEKMVRLRLIPIAEAEQPQKHRTQLVFASHDPTHPEVNELIDELGVDAFQLRYAPEHEVVDLLATAFPIKYGPLKKELHRERKQFKEEQGPRAAPEPVEQSPAAPMPDKPNTATVIQYVEELLVDAVQARAAGMCLVPNKQGKTEVYALMGEELSKWRIIDHIDMEYLFATIKGIILKGDLSGGVAVARRCLERWVDGILIRFEISAMPAGELLDREAILLRVKR